jgi:hypothetical protein
MGRLRLTLLLLQWCGSYFSLQHKNKRSMENWLLVVATNGVVPSEPFFVATGATDAMVARCEKGYWFVEDKQIEELTIDLAGDCSNQYRLVSLFDLCS